MQIFWALDTKQSIVKDNFLNYFIKAFFVLTELDI